MKKIFIIFSLMIAFIVGCAKNEEVDPNNPDNNDLVIEEQGETNEEDENSLDESDNRKEMTISIDQFLPPENVVKYFKGEGNEFAEEIETVFEKEGAYLPTTVNNGGTIVLNVYEVTGDGLYIVYQLPEFYEELPPKMEQISSEFVREEILRTPLKMGEVINDWEIVGVNESISLPIGPINNVLILEKKDDESGSINRQYWAPEYGIVKKEFYYEEEGRITMSVTTELEKMEGR